MTDEIEVYLERTVTEVRNRLDEAREGEESARLERERAERELARTVHELKQKGLI